MFLKKLLIEGKNQGVIREINFKMGVNLIIDETIKSESKQDSGNNVGKTTLLRLIDYCLGSDGENIIKDKEFKKQNNTEIENFLIEEEVLITLELIKSFYNGDEKIIIKRNFLKKGNKIQKINDEDYKKEKDFSNKLKEILFGQTPENPTFRQIIAKNIRTDKERMENILKVLPNVLKNPVLVYEALYFFWFGINTYKSKEKIKLKTDLNKEEAFQKRLKREGELDRVKSLLDGCIFEINKLENQKNILTHNNKYKDEIDFLNKIKRELNDKSSVCSELEMRKELIYESKRELENEKVNINTDQIEFLYKRAKFLVPNLQVKFEDSVRFHNDLLREKIEYITQELPELEDKIKLNNNELNLLIQKEKELIESLKKYGIDKDLEKIITNLNKIYELKGKYENIIELWIKSNENINKIKDEISIINTSNYSKFSILKDKVSKFNIYFNEISNSLYNEIYYLIPIKDKNGDIKFEISNIEGNPGTGKKKSQIAAFDLAYIKFAEELNINCLHFIIHDQLETVHDNQLNTLINEANKINCQYIFPILRSKIPIIINVDNYKILTLSQEDKLFKI